MFDFQGKYIIEMELVCQTGLHIGGTTEGYEIGGMDNPVIKTPITLEINQNGESYDVPADCPYIPGSSLKGKLRSLLEWAEGSPIKTQSAIVETGGQKEKVKPESLQPLGEDRVRGETKKDEREVEGKLVGYEASHCDCGDCDVCQIFGDSAKETTKRGPTRLYVLDAFPTKESIEDWEGELGKGIFTEAKTENAIDRLTSQANPRTMERIPAGSRFRVTMIYDLYQDGDIEKLKQVFIALRLLEDSSLGGSGSRGSGRVSFEKFKAFKRSKAYYKGEEDELTIKGLSEGMTAADITKNFGHIFTNQSKEG